VWSGEGVCLKGHWGTGDVGARLAGAGSGLSACVHITAGSGCRLLTGTAACRCRYAAKYVKEYISATVGSDVLCVGEDWVRGSAVPVAPAS